MKQIVALLMWIYEMLSNATCTANKQTPDSRAFWRNETNNNPEGIHSSLYTTVENPRDLLVKCTATNVNKSRFR